MQKLLPQGDKEQEIQLNSKSFQEDEIKGDVEFYLEPTQHWSARGIFDKNKALWGTFIIKTKIGDICFIGDSGYNDTLFKEIGKKHNIDENKFIIHEIGEFFLFDKNDLQFMNLNQMCFVYPYYMFYWIP